LLINFIIAIITFVLCDWCSFAYRRRQAICQYDNVGDVYWDTV